MPSDSRDSSAATSGVERPRPFAHAHGLAVLTGITMLVLTLRHLQVPRRRR